MLLSYQFSKRLAQQSRKNTYLVEVVVKITVNTNQWKYWVQVT
jgi:hypothetical protein